MKERREGRDEGGREGRVLNQRGWEARSKVERAVAVVVVAKQLTRNQLRGCENVRSDRGGDGCSGVNDGVERGEGGQEWERE